MNFEIIESLSQVIEKLGPGWTIDHANVWTRINKADTGYCVMDNCGWVFGMSPTKYGSPMYSHKIGHIKEEGIVKKIKSYKRMRDS